MQKTCTIPYSAEFYGGDPCSTETETLEVKYECMERILFTTKYVGCFQDNSTTDLDASTVYLYIYMNKFYFEG